LVWLSVVREDWRTVAWYPWSSSRFVTAALLRVLRLTQTALPTQNAAAVIDFNAFDKGLSAGSARAELCRGYAR
jgi:hypothetical protein